MVIVPTDRTDRRTFPACSRRCAAGPMSCGRARAMTTARRGVSPSPAWVHPADLLEVPGGVLLLAGNRIGPFGVIGMLGSPVGEFDFARRFTIVDTLVSRDSGYPSGVTLQDGRVLVLYYTSADAQHKDWPHPHVGAATFRVPQKGF